MPALRVRLSATDGAPPAEGPDDEPVVVATEPADTLGPGETVIRQGAATVYVPAVLTRRYEQATLDVHDRGAVDAPSLVVRGSP